MYKSLSGSLSVCFLRNILALNSRANGNQPQKITVMNYDTMQQSYPDLYIQRCLLKVLSIKKTTKSMIENIQLLTAVFLQVEFYKFTPGVHSRKDPQLLSHMTSDSKYLAVLESSSLSMTPNEVQPKVHSECTLRVH